MDRPPAGALRVALVDPDAGDRARLRGILHHTAGMPPLIVAECGTADALLDHDLQLPLDAVFIEVTGPGGWGLAESETWSGWRPEFVIVTADHKHAARAFDVGAIDYLTKPVSEARVLETLSRLWRRRRSGALGAHKPGTPSQLSHPLTPRQLEILNLLGQGLPNKQIARITGLSHFTVRNYIAELFRLFGVSRRDALAAAARLARPVTEGEPAAVTADRSSRAVLTLSDIPSSCGVRRQSGVRDGKSGRAASGEIQPAVGEARPDLQPLTNPRSVQPLAPVPPKEPSVERPQ